MKEFLQYIDFSGIFHLKLGLLNHILMSFNKNYYVFFFLFFLYGVYASATEGISKAWISNISDRKDTATAIGTFSSFQSIFTMLASSLAGFIWYKFGAEVTFLVSAMVTVLVVIYFLIFVNVKS